MGRKLEFSKVEAMQKAMESFWAKGYDATSMRDLAERLGLHLGSVYNALGDKNKVFEEALKLNLEHHVLPNLRQMTAAPDAVAGIDEYMERVVAECSSKECTPGCFLVNSLLDINNINDSITATLKRYLVEIEEFFVTSVRQGIEAGTISADKSAEKYGRFIMSACYTMRTMGKLGMPQEYIRDIKDCMMSSIKCKAYQN